MHLAAGEVLEGRSVAGAGEETDVDLEIVAEGEGDFVLAFGDELVDEGEGRDVLDGCRDDVGFACGSGGEEVEVADGLAAAAERAGGDDLVDAREGADEIDDGVGVLLGFVDAEAAGVLAVVFDAFEELGDELFAHAGKLGEVTGFGGGFEAVNVTDLAGGPDESYGFGSHAGETKEFEHGGFVFLQELFAEWHGSGGEEGLDVRKHAFANAGDGEELFGVVCDGGELGGLLLDCLGGAAVGADAEGVGGVDFEERGGFVEEAGDRDIVHSEASEASAATESVCNKSICNMRGEGAEQG